MEKNTAINALGALAQETRLDIFRLLVQTGPSGLSPGELSGRLGLPGATLSFHLNTLRHAGLVQCQRKSRSLIYSANFQTMNQLLTYLMENCCAGQSPCAIPICESDSQEI